MPDSPPSTQKRRRLERVSAACDLCKRRKVKCDGMQPCEYCTKKNLASSCTFSAAHARGASHLAHSPRAIMANRTGDNSPLLVSRSRTHSQRDINQHDGDGGSVTSVSPTASGYDHHEDTVVPLEGRILRDAQGKVIFIGDCAPLSFLQTVRYLITAEVDPEGFAIQAARDSLIEVARPSTYHRQRPPSIPLHEVRSLVEAYTIATAGLVELFGHDELLEEIQAWANGLIARSDEASAAIFYLVLAIGAQESQEDRAEAWCDHARSLLLRHMCNSMNVSTVQGFTLITIFMLRAFQSNGAYLYFSLAARTAYAIGIHRTEVNASFGDSIRIRRDRIWKSLRIVDMLISTVLGRPPSTSDVDCTVKYSLLEEPNQAASIILDASVQIFMIIERVVVEVYSRKRISLRIAEYVSRQLKSWASKWLQDLNGFTSNHTDSVQPRYVLVGACSALCSYYYGIMLLTRPFLIYEVYEHLGANLRGGGSHNDHLEKRRYADAALDAATAFVENLQPILRGKFLPRRMPLIVPWLFTAALVLAVGILGRSGLLCDDTCKASIECLDYFGEIDPHARQYSIIVQSLLKITTKYVKQRESDIRLQRKQASSELFGLLPLSPTRRNRATSTGVTRRYSQSEILPTQSQNPEVDQGVPADWTMYDADFFAMPWSNENDQGLQDFLQPGAINLEGATVADIPLFPMYDQQIGVNFP